MRLSQAKPSAGSRPFLFPTWQKLVFLLEWSLFILIQLLRGEIESWQAAWVTAYPLMGFYLIACVISAQNPERESQASLRCLFTWVAGFILLDQGIKAIVLLLLPYEAAIPVVPGWLNLAHEHNEQGLWLISLFTSQPHPVALWPLKLLFLASFCLAAPGYQLYTETKRNNLWVQIAFIGLSAGLGGAIVDLFLRGLVVDYLQLPGVVTADLKDIYASLGLSAFLVEGLATGSLLKWVGWKQEAQQTAGFAKDLAAYYARDVKTFWRWLCTALIKIGWMKRRK